MKKKIKTYFLCALVVGSIAFAAAASPPGQDPLITLGFFQQEIATLSAGINQQIQNLRTETTLQMQGLRADLTGGSAGGVPEITEETLGQLAEQIREQLRNELWAEVQGEMYALRNDTAELSHRLAVAEFELSAASGESAQVAELRTGQVIIGNTGTRMILRGGSANAFSLVENGLADLTTGIEIFNGEHVPLNHDLLVSRNDTRGLIITSDVAWVLIQGEYRIY